MQKMSKTSIVSLIIIIVVVVIGGALYWESYQGLSSITPSVAASSSPAGELFAGSIYAPNSYLISTGAFDASTTRALSGFTVQTSTNADGSMQITLNAVNPEYQTQTYTVQPGEQLYFIEANLSDDSAGADNFPGDDNAVLVGQNGYIVQVGSPPAGSSGINASPPPQGKG